MVKGARAFLLLDADMEFLLLFSVPPLPTFGVRDRTIYTDARDRTVYTDARDRTVYTDARSRDIYV